MKLLLYNKTRIFQTLFALINFAGRKIFIFKTVITENTRGEGGQKVPKSVTYFLNFPEVNYMSILFSGCSTSGQTSSGTLDVEDEEPVAGDGLHRPCHRPTSSQRS